MSPHLDAAALLRFHIPGVDEANYGKSLADLGIDSFSLLELRLKIEQILGGPVADPQWVALESPAAILDFIAGRIETDDRSLPLSVAVTTATLHRGQIINMPQMALGGLSESWLCKQLGDIHWEMICTGLGARSHELVDGSGDRLYATFTRLRIGLSRPLVAFTENEHLEITANPARFGAGIFFSQADAGCNGKTIRATIMSSFTKRGSITDNTTLLKGQPSIPADCGIEVLSEMPEFGIQYRNRRNSTLSPAEFECEYRLIPFHDINGVGLLYFAAYPTISDICELEYMGRGNRWASEASTTQRDIYYFANCDIDDRIIYRVHARRDLDGAVEIESSLSRKSDGRTMAYLVTRKELIDG